MPITTVAASGTRVPLTTTVISAAKVTIQRLPGNTNGVFVGIPGQINTGTGVTTTAYDFRLDVANPVVVIGGLGEGHNPIQVNLINLDVTTNGEGVNWYMEQD